MPELGNIFMKYEERCKTSNAMDFDDLLVNTYKLLNNNEEIRSKYSQRFAYILVDEYQDTNFAQQAIVTLLANDHRKICVVGDDAQSIYSFRGANIDNILKFNEIYPEAKLYKLEQNYRSTQNIVMAANSLIKHNQHQIPKNVFSNKESGNKLILKPAYSDKEESMIVCKDIKRIKRGEQMQWSDFAILYRTNSQSRSFEEYMRKENIPYRIYGGMSFYQHKEIKDIVSYFRIVVNPNDEEALKRIINYPTRGIGDTTLSKIVQASSNYGVSLWQVISQPMLYHLNVSKATMSKLESFRLLIEEWMDRVNNDDAYILGHDIIKESGISKDIYSGKEPEDLSRQQNVEELIGGMQDFVESRKEEGLSEHIYMSDYLQEIALLTDVESSSNSDEDSKVVLMTIHSAKGLEFPVVFIVGLEENIFPSPMSCNSLRELEEERRLLYVAITRAEKYCFLTCAQNRFRYGRVEFGTPSRFIKEIDSRLISVETAAKDFMPTNQMMSRMAYGERNVVGNNSYLTAKANTNPTKPSSQITRMPLVSSGRLKPIQSTSSFSNQASAIKDSLNIGSVIEHQRFGLGQVINIEGTGENMKATVEFRNAGTKQLLLKFAKYTIVS
jgi:DNA helicase-2/ATP-dependent DNA helicase PcrA